jgi:hypothetical protein
VSNLARTLVGNLRRYPKWYALVVAWLLVMALVPVVRHAAPRLAERSRVEAPIQTAAPLPPAVDVAAPVIVPSLSPAPPVVLGVPPLPALPAPTPSPPPQPGEGGLELPALPALPLPEAPEQLQPLFDAMAPLMASGCSGVGLAAVVIAVVAPTVEQVPLEALLPYLVPVYSACAYFPIPKTHTLCPLDDQVAAQLPDSLTSLYPAPAVIGVGLDTIAGIEAAVLQMTGQQVPSLAASLRDQLDCRIE